MRIDPPTVEARIVPRRQQRLERLGQRPRRVGQQPRAARQRLVLLGIQHVQDHRRQQRVRALLPERPRLVLPLGVDQHVGDGLRVLHVPRPARHEQQRVVGGGRAVGARQIEPQAGLAEHLAAVAGGQVPELALDVEHHDRRRPGEQRRDHQAGGLAAPGRREGQHVPVAAVGQPMEPRPQLPGSAPMPGADDDGGRAGRRRRRPQRRQERQGRERLGDPRRAGVRRRLWQPPVQAGRELGQRVIAAGFEPPTPTLRRWRGLAQARKRRRRRRAAAVQERLLSRLEGRRSRPDAAWSRVRAVAGTSVPPTAASAPGVR